MIRLQSAVGFVRDLVAFPTVTFSPNLDLIDYVSAYLTGLGATVRLSHSEDRTRANLFATFGPDEDGGLILAGHTDVVPVLEEDWTSDPFVVDERGGRLYGRGTCDMKGFLGCLLAVAPRIASAQLARPIHLAFTYDEEVACLGAEVLVEQLARTGPRARVALIGEPTAMKIIEAHKGMWEFTTEFVGVSGHGSQPAYAVNAVEYASRFVTRLMDLARELRASAPTDSPFDPPHSSISVGVMQGGIGRNVVAGECRVEWEMRPIQRNDVDRVLSTMAEFAESELLPDMRRVFPGASVTTHIVGGVRGLRRGPDSEAAALVSGIDPSAPREVVSFGTEAGLFQQAGISAVVWGPGSIEQAHTTDEYIEISQLERCLEALEVLITGEERT